MDEEQFDKIKWCWTIFCIMLVIVFYEILVYRSNISFLLAMLIYIPSVFGIFSLGLYLIKRFKEK